MQFRILIALILAFVLGQDHLFANSKHNKDQFFEIGRGKYSNLSSVHHSFINSTVAPTEEHLWQYGGEHTYMTAAATLYLSSSDNSDVEVIEIVGLDDDWLLQTVSTTLTGQTTVAVSGSWLRVFSIRNTSSTNFDGTVYLAELDTISSGVPNTASKVRLSALPSDQQAFFPGYTMPANTTGYLVSVQINSDDTDEGNCRIRKRKTSESFSNLIRAFPSIYHPFEWGSKTTIKLEPKSDIDFLCLNSDGNAAFTGQFELILDDRN